MSEETVGNVSGFNPTAVPSIDNSMSSLSWNASFDLVEYLESYLGSRYRNLWESVTLTFVYCLIFMTGAVGNVSTVIVIAKNRFMHTATNYYLLSLAVSDALTLCLGLPPELYTIWEAYPWRFGEPYCLFKTFLTETTSTASVLTISAFTIERYLAICHPLRARQTFSGLDRAVQVIAIIWIVACLASIPYPIHTRTFHSVFDPTAPGSPLEDSLICSIPFEWQPMMKIVFQVYTFVLFVLPMIIMIVLYVRIGVALRNPQIAAHSFRSSRTPVQLYSRRAVLKILVAVVFAFFICWAPFHAQRIMTVCIPDNSWTPTLLEGQSALFYLSGVLYYVSATVNPILYNLMSRKFRQAFVRTLCFCCSRRTNHHRSRDRKVNRRYGDIFQNGSGNTDCATLEGNCLRNNPSPQSHEEKSTVIGKFQMGRGHLVVPKLLVLPLRRRSPKRDFIQTDRTRDRARKMADRGSDDDYDEETGSVSSLPSTLAAYIREEMEMSNSDGFQGADELGQGDDVLTLSSTSGQCETVLPLPYEQGKEETEVPV